MFVKFKNKAFNKNKMFLKIIDTDFEEELLIDVSTIGYRNSTIKYNLYPIVIEAIIKCYSNKQLNVGKNIFLFMRQNALDRMSLDYNNQIKHYNYACSEFKKYLPEIEKYLLLV